jgi:hypothetical protein
MRNKTMLTKESINQIVEKSLAQLLRQLKEAKLQQEKWGSCAWPSKFESLNEGIKALENILFASVDDFGSVKELIEMEQFFLRSEILCCYTFPAYKSHINPMLYAYAEIEVQLDTLEMKSLDLACRGHSLAAAEIKGIAFEVRNLNRWYFSEKKIDYNDYKARALQAINEGRPVLEKHRGYKQILGNLALLILTVGTAFLINKACTGHFLFFKQTESAKQINALNQTISICSLQKHNQVVP